MAVYTEDNFITREELCNIFFDEKDPDTFYDIFESDGASPRFDCTHSNTISISDGECYIIDRETGNYVNWYKETHFGRSYTTNMATKDELIQFVHDFYEEVEKDWNK